MIPFSDPRSHGLIKSSSLRPDIIESFSYQRNNCRCGLACIKTILFAANKLSFSDKELSTGIIEPYLKKHPFKNGRTVDDIDDKTQDYAGMSLLDIHELGNRFFKNSKKSRGAETNFQDFLNDVKKSMSSDHYLVIQFLASQIGLNLNGHFSVVGGYNDKSSKLLMIDPARHRHRWYWVDAIKIFKATQTKMQSTGLDRGYLLFWD